MGKPSQRGVSLPKDLLAEVEKLLTLHPELRALYGSVTGFVKAAMRARIGQERTLADYLRRNKGSVLHLAPRCPNCRAPLAWLDPEEVPWASEGTVVWVCTLNCGYSEVQGPERPASEFESTFTAAEKREMDAFWARERDDRLRGGREAGHFSRVLVERRGEFIQRGAEDGKPRPRSAQR